MNNKIFLGLVVVAVGALVGWYFLKGNAPVVPNQTVVETPTPAGSNLGAPESSTSAAGNALDKGGVMARVVVTYTDSGFAPNPLTVKAGTTVTFVNESTSTLWVASDPHPTHTLLLGLDALASVSKGGSYEYTFAKVGTWTYHNHTNPSIKGKVIVTQ